MLRNKIKLINIAKYIQNHLKNKTKIPKIGVIWVSPRRSLTNLVFSTNSSNVNGFQKFIMDKRGLEFNKRKNKFSKISDEKCWKCKQYFEVKKFSCSLCGALQYPKQNFNYFELLGVSQSYDIDVEDLSSKFKNLQMVFHPDKFVNKSKEEMEISEIYSRLINKAYTVLKDPLARGFYILQLHKVPLESNFPVGQEFLMSVMEKNEELDVINSENLLKRFMNANNKVMEKKIKEVSEAFHSSKFDEAKIKLFQLNYFVNLDSKGKKKQIEFFSPEKN